ncbi:MAG: peptidylprolyl isomerase [Deltaproteobacteria bacterium]|nr:peptidylprolyl isomerase [Deltaproteobacteria bacterium]
MTTIAKDKAVSIHYTLTLDGGQVIDSSEGKDPLVYLHGHGNIIPGLEKELVGKGIGEKLSVTVVPEEGYGVHNPGLIQEVPREAFQGVDNLEVGMMFQAPGEGGHIQLIRIAGIEGDKITVDGNHELAGKTLNFAVEISEIREASPEELSHGHVHGPGGHQH